eukprot:gb/GEZN01006455.1/.p1 GENE.gb/GEZN01006455.1/~~gb/GEZN01006455.1/.p1  ORF type:complete len:478 (-),score=59.25 gb/GEZN01006455.1/:228-1613(-)
MLSLSGGIALPSLPSRLRVSFPSGEEAPSERVLLLNLPITLLLNLFMVGLMTIPNVSKASQLAFVVVLLLIQVVYSIWASFGVALRMVHYTTNLKLIFGAYLAHVTVFAGCYFALLIMDVNSIRLHESSKLSTPTTSKDYFNLFVLCLYYSLATMTHTGYGDIYPDSIACFVISSVEILLGVAYNVLVFVVALSMFLAAKDLQNVSLVAPPPDPWGWRGMKRRCLNRHPWFSSVRKFLINWLFPVVLVWQALSVILLVKITGSSNSDNDNTAIIIYGFLQFCALGLMFSMSMRVASKMNTKQEVSAGFLLQSYLSSIFMFAGVYFLLMVSTERPDDAWYGLAVQNEEGRVTALEQGFVQLLYFSLVTMSTVGYGDIFPISSAGRLMVCFQMAAAQIYSVQIMGSGGAAIIKRLPSVRRLRVQSNDASRGDPLLRAEQAVDEYEMIPPEVSRSNVNLNQPNL